MKKKRILRFSLARRGYDIDEVENFIEQEKARTDDALLAERERIASLKEQVKSLSDENAELHGREAEIQAAFINATRDAERLSKDIKRQYQQELDRLRLFRAKWTGAYEQLKDRYHFDKDALNMESVAVSTELELQKLLMQDFSLNRGDEENEMESYFRSEVERLTGSLPKSEVDDPPTPAVKELNDKLKEAEKRKRTGAAFSLDEAAHPTDSLEDICRSLGIKPLGSEADSK